MSRQQRPKTKYKSGRGFSVHEDVVQPLQSMRTGMQGSMAARWGGASLDFDWRHASNMYAEPLVGPKKVKPGKGRPEAPEEQAPVTGPTTPGPMTLQSHVSPESSILPSDQSKSGMASDSPVWSSAAQPLGYAGDAVRPAAHSAALPSHPIGSSLPWAPGRGVGPPAKPSILPAPFLRGGNAYDTSVSDRSTWPGGDAATGGIGDSSIYSATGTVTGGLDSAIWPASPYKSAPGADKKVKRPAGMSPVALGQIGVVRRTGGWPGNA